MQVNQVHFFMELKRFNIIQGNWNRVVKVCVRPKLSHKIRQDKEKRYLLTTGDDLHVKLLETDGTLLHKGTIFAGMSSVSVTAVFRRDRVVIDHNSF